VTTLKLEFISRGGERNFQKCNLTGAFERKNEGKANKKGGVRKSFNARVGRRGKQKLGGVGFKSKNQLIFENSWIRHRGDRGGFLEQRKRKKENSIRGEATNCTGKRVLEISFFHEFVIIRNSIPLWG